MPHYLRLCVLACGLGLSACTHATYTVYALTSSGSLVTFQSNKPATISNTVTVTGLPSGDSLVQLTYRPSDATLYGLTSNNELSTVDPTSGVATVVSTTQFSTQTLVNATASFDPIEDQMRVLSSQYNYLVDPTSGVVATDGTLIAFDSGDSNVNKTPELLSIAYDNDIPKATTTTLYALDEATYSLVQVGGLNQSTPSSVNDGLLHTIGATGISFAFAGLAIDEKNGDAIAALAPSGSPAALYNIDLKTGAASEIDTIGNGELTIISIALLPDIAS